ncbi:MAG: hypothetical protein KJ063_02620 [Anaerolineae bacterium]|nr:hypothetical protein [Anaerolineae bacterium]
MKFNPAPTDIFGFACSITVDHIDSTIEKIAQAGGKTLMPKAVIPGAAWGAKFLHPEGNLFCAIQYTADARLQRLKEAHTQPLQDEHYEI